MCIREGKAPTIAYLTTLREHGREEKMNFYPYPTIAAGKSKVFLFDAKKKPRIKNHPPAWAIHAEG